MILRNNFIKKIKEICPFIIMNQNLPPIHYQKDRQEHYCKKISFFQRLENAQVDKNPNYKKILSTAIITARNAPAHERVVTTLKSLNIEVDDVFFLGGIDKTRILNILKPHIFFDDQMIHLDHLEDIPAVHIPFGIANKRDSDIVEK